MMDELRNSTTTQQTETDGDEQRKSLISNVYSNNGMSDPDPYKKLGNWGVDQQDIKLAYDVTAGGGLVRRNLKRITPSGSHEEWYTEFQVALAHRIAQLTGEEMPDGRDVRGAVPVMEHLSIDASDIMEYLRANPQMVNQLDTEELARLADEQEDSDEGAEA